MLGQDWEFTYMFSPAVGDILPPSHGQGLR